LVYLDKKAVMWGWKYSRFNKKAKGMKALYLEHQAIEFTSSTSF